MAAHDMDSGELEDAYLAHAEERLADEMESLRTYEDGPQIDIDPSDPDTEAWLE
jgi:hypothetical protein